MGGQSSILNKEIRYKTELDAQFACDIQNKFINWEDKEFDFYERYKFIFGWAECQKPHYIVNKIDNYYIVHYIDPTKEWNSNSHTMPLSYMNDFILKMSLGFSLKGLFSYFSPSSTKNTYSIDQLYASATSSDFFPLQTDTPDNLRYKIDLNDRAAMGELMLDLMSPDRESDLTEYQSNSLRARELLNTS